jgi:hypothetical protein
VSVRLNVRLGETSPAGSSTRMRARCLARKVPGVHWRKITTSVVVTIGAVALAGCSGTDTAAPAKTAVAFMTAVSSSDGSQACALLSDAVVHALSQNKGTGCAQAVLQEQLPHPAPVIGLQTYGRQAFVVTKTDTLFLSQFPTGWKVIAAGCQPDGDKTYDCAVSGR